MSLTYKPGVDNYQLDLQAKIQVCMSVRSSVRARNTHRHAETQIIPKLLHCVASLTWGVMKHVMGDP